MAAGACEQEGTAWVGAATDAFRQTPAATELGSLWSAVLARTTNGTSLTGQGANTKGPARHAGPVVTYR
jgi:hypothetical protein